MKISDGTCFTNSQKRRICLGAFLLLVFGGIIGGTVVVCASDSVNWLNRLLFTHNMYKSAEGLLTIRQFLRSLVPILVLLAVQFFSGFFAFGQAFAAVTAVSRGAAAGISAALVYLAMGKGGFFAVLLTVFPFAVTSAAVIILGARESAKLSGQIAKFSFFGESGENTSPDVKLYSLKFGVLAVFGIVLSAADVLISYFIGGMLHG
ncbi:MAG: hypothetical protein ACI4JB_00020 [Porcipelethomonas sp.]